MIMPALVAAIIVGEWLRREPASVDEVSVTQALARPKSRTLALPSEVTTTFAGFKSRWITPLS